MSNAIASLSMQLGLDTRQFTDGVTATQRELKLLRKVMEDTKTPQEELQQQLDGIQRIREKFTTVPEAKWEAAIEKIKQRYWEVNAIQAEIVDEGARIPTPGKMVGADALGFAGGQLTSRIGILGEMQGAAAAAGPWGVAITASLAGVTVAATAAAKGIELIATTTLDGIERLNRLNDEATLLGVTASSLQRLEIAARLGGASVESVTSAMRKMGMVLGDPSAATVKTLQAMGLEVDKLRNMRADQAFAAIGVEIDKLPTKAEQLAAISDIFGKGNIEIANLLGNFGQFMSEADAFTLTDQQFAAIGAADDAMDKLGLNMTRVADITTATLSPAVEDISKQLMDFLSQDTTQTKLLAGLLAIKHTIEVIPDVAQAVITSFDQMAKSGTFGTIIQSLSMLNSMLPESIDKTDMLFGSFMSEAAATEEMNKLDKTLADIQGKAAGASGEIADTIEQTFVASTTEAVNAVDKLTEAIFASQAVAATGDAGAAAMFAIFDAAGVAKSEVDKLNASIEAINASDISEEEKAKSIEAIAQAAVAATKEIERAKAFADKLAGMTSDAIESATEQGKARLEAKKFGASTESEIQAYMEVAAELDRVKKAEQDLAEVQRDRQQRAINDAQEYQRMVSKLETPEDRAKRELQRFAELGATQLEIDAMAEQMASGLMKKQGSTAALSGIVKGSKEDIATQFARQREDRQQKTLTEIRDALRAQLKKDVVLVEEVSIL